MTKPDFRAITLKQLRDYLRANRTDEEAWDIFFDRVDREAKKSPLYPPITNPEQLDRLLKDNPEIRARFGI